MSKKNNINNNKVKQTKITIQEYLRSTDKEYYVPDVQNYENTEADKNKNEYLFIFESLHTEEVNNKYPLAGNSGKAVTKFLFGDAVSNSFGKLVKNKAEILGTKYINIMNISNVPLQKTDKNKAEYNALEKELKALRKPNASSEKDGFDCLLDLFTKKLGTFLKTRDSKQNNIYIFVFGATAINYFEQAINEQTIKGHLDNNLYDIIYFPHPSMSNWTNKRKMKYKENLPILKKEFDPLYLLPSERMNRTFQITFTIKEI